MWFNFATSVGKYMEHENRGWLIRAREGQSHRQGKLNVTDVMPEAGFVWV